MSHHHGHAHGHAHGAAGSAAAQRPWRVVNIVDPSAFDRESRHGSHASESQHLFSMLRAAVEPKAHPHVTHEETGTKCTPTDLDVLAHKAQPGRGLSELFHALSSRVIDDADDKDVLGELVDVRAFPLKKGSPHHASDFERAHEHLAGFLHLADSHATSPKSGSSSELAFLLDRLHLAHGVSRDDAFHALRDALHEHGKHAAKFWSIELKGGMRVVACEDPESRVVYFIRAEHE